MSKLHVRFSSGDQEEWIIDNGTKEELEEMLTEHGLISVWFQDAGRRFVRLNLALVGKIELE